MVIVSTTNKEIILDLEAVYKDMTTGKEGYKFLILTSDGRIFLKVAKSCES